VIEPPGGGPLRRDALGFAHFRAGARSVTIDPDDAQARDRLRTLVATRTSSSARCRRGCAIPR